MFYLKKRIELAGSHYLDLPYDSKCKNQHGHNWIITVYCKSEELNNSGMVVDFGDIKTVVNHLDHSHLNDIIEQPTAENICMYILDSINHFTKSNICYKVKVQESEGNEVLYED